MVEIGDFRPMLVNYGQEIESPALTLPLWIRILGSLRIRKSQPRF